MYIVLLVAAGYEPREATFLGVWSFFLSQPVLYRMSAVMEALMPVLTNGFSSYNVLFADGPYGTTQKYTNAERRLNRLMRKGQGGRRLRAVLYALTGNAPGQQAVLTAVRRSAVRALGSDSNQGGLIPIETVTFVNRPTTALDLLKMQDDMTHNNKPTPYPRPLGNPVSYTGMTNKIA